MTLRRISKIKMEKAKIVLSANNFSKAPATQDNLSYTLCTSVALSEKCLSKLSFRRYYIKL